MLEAKEEEKKRFWTDTHTEREREETQGNRSRSSCFCISSEPESHLSPPLAPPAHTVFFLSPSWYGHLPFSFAHFHVLTVFFCLFFCGFCTREKERKKERKKEKSRDIEGKETRRYRYVMAE
jgi:hypothetical protein